MDLSSYFAKVFIKENAAVKNVKSNVVDQKPHHFHGWRGSQVKYISVAEHESQGTASFSQLAPEPH
jgi:hypothetical protein